MKIVINSEFGGFGYECSSVFTNRCCAKTGQEDFDSMPRDNKVFVEIVEETLAGDNPDDAGKLKVVEIPDGSFWKISAYDGCEVVYFAKSEIGVVS